ncbi:hypothetical protein TAMC210_19140 [Thermanaeromonas sp. C210]|nr:hypothetical protein TAMC210_19140 [Thermanaeromonas sp. C210]
MSLFLARTRELNILSFPFYLTRIIVKQKKQEKKLVISRKNGICAEFH